MAAVSADVEDLPLVCTEVLAVAATHVAVERAHREGLQISLDLGPRLVPSVAEVWSYLFIDLIYMLLLHVSCNDLL